MSVQEQRLRANMTESVTTRLGRTSAGVLRDTLDQDVRLM